MEIKNIKKNVLIIRRTHVPLRNQKTANLENVLNGLGCSALIGMGVTNVRGFKMTIKRYAGENLSVLEALDTISDYCEHHYCDNCILRTLCDKEEKTAPKEWCTEVVENSIDFRCKFKHDKECHWSLNVAKCEYDSIRKQMFNCVGYCPNGVKNG